MAMGVLPFKIPCMYKRNITNLSSIKNIKHIKLLKQAFRMLI